MKKIITILMVSFILVACKKEKQIENNLWKQGGTWEIEYYEDTYIDFQGEKTMERQENIGTMKFKKDGTMIITIKDGYGGSSQALMNSYDVTKNSLTLIDEDGYGVVYDMVWKRNEFVITNTENIYKDIYADNGEHMTVVATSIAEYGCRKSK